MSMLNGERKLHITLQQPDDKMLHQMWPNKTKITRMSLAMTF